MMRLDEKWQLTRETVGDGRLSIVMPFFRLAGSAAANIHEVAELFECHGVETEIVPVDDGSGDGTDEILDKILRDFELEEYEHVTLKPVICPCNGGKGAALRAGFAASSGRYVMLLDGDLDISPRQTPYFFEQMALQQADIVVGSKRHPRSVVQYPWHRRLVSACYFTLVRLAFGLRLTDTQTGMKLFKREALGAALDRMLVKEYAFDLEILVIAAQRGAKVVEAPVVIRFGNKFGALRPHTIRSMARDTLAVFYRRRILNYYAKCLVPPKFDRQPLVSIVIACPKESWMLDECLKAIQGQSYPNWEVIVLPDECDDSPWTKDARIRFYPTGKIRPAGKRNLGTHAANGEIIAFIDDDAYPDAHWLEYAVKYFGEPSIGAVGGPGVTPPGEKGLALIGGLVYENPLVSGTYRYRYRAGGVRRDVDDYPSCNLFVRRSVLDRIGGYRVTFWPGEDTLLCRDIIQKSWKRIVYDPWVIVYHHRRPLFLPHLRQLGRYAFHRGYFSKRFPSNSRRFSYYVPTIFDIYLAFVAFVAFLDSLPGETLPLYLWSTFLAPLALYLLLVACTTFSFRPHRWLLTILGVFVSHVWYGIRFCHGVCALEAPCEYIGGDHGSALYLAEYLDEL